MAILQDSADLLVPLNIEIPIKDRSFYFSLLMEEPLAWALKLKKILMLILRVGLQTQRSTP